MKKTWYGLPFRNVRVIIPAIIFVLAGRGLPFVLAQEAESFLRTKIQKVPASLVLGADRIKQFQRTLKIPEEIGSVKEMYRPANPREELVINIQDLHCNYSAQKNIANILEYLCKTYQIRFIGIEGGAGVIDTSFYRSLTDPHIRAEVMDYFLREARINGTEFFATTTERDIILVGVEDREYYQKNLDAFMKSLPRRERILRDLAIIENNLNIIKNQVFNKSLKELDDHVVAYANETIGVEEVVRYLAESYPPRKLLNEFPQISQFLEAMRLSQKMDTKKIEGERDQVIEYLTRYLTRRELEEFVRLSVEFKARNVDEMTYYTALKQLYQTMESQTKPFDNTWPDLSRYIVYLVKYETLDKYQLFSDIDILAERIKDMMFINAQEKRVNHYLSAVRLARNLFSAKLLTRDLAKLKNYRQDFNTRRLKNFIQEEANRLGINLFIPGDLDPLEETLPLMEDFYRYAMKRNRILATNTLNAMREQKQAIGIVVTGGFHTEGVTEYFHEHRIAYVVILPKVDKLDEDDSRYIKALKGEPTPFEKMIQEGTPAEPSLPQR